MRGITRQPWIRRNGGRIVLTKWFQTTGCRNGNACTPCRHSRAFRETIVVAGLIDSPEFECPFAMDPPSPHEGPGTRLMRLLKRIGFRYSPQCGCQDAVLKLNLKGMAWARENVDWVLGVMRSAAGDPESNPLRIPFNEWGARKLALHCFKDSSRH